MSECFLDPTAMCNLTDSVIYVIETSTSPELAPARQLIERIRKREFVSYPSLSMLYLFLMCMCWYQYSCLGKTVYQRNSRIDGMSVEEIKQTLVDLANESITKQRAQQQDRAGQSPYADLQSLPDGSNDGYGDLEFIQSQDSFAPWLKKFSASDASTSEGDSIVTVDDIIVEKMHIHYGMKSENPVNRLRFYSKDLPVDGLAKKVKEKSYETLLPRVFEELAVRVFCRNPKKNSYVMRAFQDWCRECYASSPFPSLSQV